MRTRLIDTAPRNGGTLCPARDMVEMAPCNQEACGDKNSPVVGMTKSSRRQESFLLYILMDS